MRYINIDNLQEQFDKINGDGKFDEWLRNAAIHLNNIRSLNQKQRSDYWSKNNHWKELYTTLSELSGHKCWYSEAPENSSEWEIEHYRPKAYSKDENKIVIRDDGYWWLSYHWKNFRLAGSLVNKLRKDRFTDSDDVFGKGNYFPLENKSNVAVPEDMYCTNEVPILLDPTKSRDCTLLAFDKDGDIFPKFSNDENPIKYKKAEFSIKYYGLKHTPIQRGRKRIWEQCNSLVDLANNHIKTYFANEQEVENKIEYCFSELAKMSLQTAPYTSVVKSFVLDKSQEPNYEWLKDAMLVMQ